MSQAQDTFAPAQPVWTQREIMIVAVLGVTFGILYLGWTQLWLLTAAINLHLSISVFFGFWCVVPVIAAYVIRKPFVAVTAEVIAAGAQVLLGNASGLTLLLTGLIQGAGAELPFAATRWKRYDTAILLASGACAAVFSFVYNVLRFDMGKLGFWFLVLVLAVRIVSGMILAGLLGRFIAERLHATGVLDGLALDDAKRAAKA